MSDKIVYLVTGSNRGIGLGLVSKLATRSNAVVFAGARNPAAESLVDLSAQHPNVYPIKFVANDQANNEAAIAEIKSIAGRLDVIIANAGLSDHFGPLATTPLAKYAEFLQVNTLGTVCLFQAAQELLLASPTGTPIFAYITTGSASMGRHLSMGLGAYACSKAASNFFIKALDAEIPSLVTFVISPGWVATDMGNFGATSSGLPEAPVTVPDAVDGIMSRVDGATKEKSSGRFWNYKATFDGNPWDIDTEEIPW